MDLEALEKQVVLMEDIQAVETLQRTYGYYFDTRQFHEIVNLFSENTAYVEIESHGRFAGKGRGQTDVLFGWDGSRQTPGEPDKQTDCGVATVIMQLGGVVDRESRWQHRLGPLANLAGGKLSLWRPFGAVLAAGLL